jgi:Flp pilus assembly protein CpaB
MTYRVRNIVIAVGLALVAAMLTTFYVSNYKRSVQQGESQATVYVAARDVPAGVSGTELAKGHTLRAVQVTKRNIVPGAIANPEEVSKLALAQPLYKGEQVTLRRFADVQALGIRAQLKGTLRGVQVPGTANQVLAGTLKAGDHVDLVSQIKNTDLTRIVLRDIPVLAAPAQPSGGNVASSGEWSVLLAVSDTHIQALWHEVDGHSNDDVNWSLALRPVADAVDSGERLESSRSIAVSGISNAELRRISGAKCNCAAPGGR